MTRNEFIENITEWWHLIDFCRDEDCIICEDIYDDYVLDEMINDDIYNAVRDSVDWHEVRDRLNDIDRSYDYYLCEGYMVYEGLNNGDDFLRYKNHVLNWMDENGLWDEEDEDDVLDFDYPVETEDEDEYQEPEEEFSVAELVSLCVRDVAIQQNEDVRRRADERAEIDRALAELIPFFDIGTA